MTRTRLLAAVLAGAAGAASAIEPTPNLTRNPGFLDVDADGTTGDEWGAFGAALATIDFFGDGNPGHGTLFGDNVDNEGGVFQAGIPAEAGTTYELTVRIQWEANWDAATFYGLEFYAADDATKLDERIVEITEEFLDFGYRRHDLTATAPPDTAFVRPIVLFSDVQSGGASRAATVDNVLVREADDVLNLNPGFGDVVGDGNNGDFWGTFGAAALDLDFFNNGNPGHATLFADNPGNAGGVFQQAVPAVPGESYTFTVDVSFEENWDADTFFGLEFYGADDAFLVLQEVEEIVETPGLGYVTYQMEAVAPAAFTTFVRPIVLFENAAAAGPGRAATIDNALVQLTSTVDPGCNVADVADPFGELNFFDVSAYLQLFGDADPRADLNDDGLFNFFDVSAFLTAFNAGCP